MNLDEKKKFILNFLYIVACVLIIFFSVKIASTYFLPFLIGIIISFFVQKPAEYISQKLNIKKQFVAALLSVIFYFFVLIILFIILWVLYEKINSLLKLLLQQNSFETFLNRINSFLNDNFNINSEVLKTTASSLLEKVTDYFSSAVAVLAEKAPTILLTSFITIIATFYISRDYDKLKLFLCGIISDKIYIKVKYFKQIFIECSLKYTKGYLIMFLITFTELVIGFWILHVKKVFTVALLVALLDLLPVFGTGTALLPWSIFGILQGNYLKAGGLIVLYLITVFVRNFLEPKIIGKQIDINPLFTLIFIFVGFKIGGIVGIIVFPILMSVIFTYLRNQVAENK